MLPSHAKCIDLIYPYCMYLHERVSVHHIPTCTGAPKGGMSQFAGVPSRAHVLDSASMLGVYPVQLETLKDVPRNNYFPLFVPYPCNAHYLS